jgi:hypothetical protein
VTALSTPLAEASIEHRSNGRLRVRIPRRYRNRLGRIREDLAGHPAADEVRVSAQTRSVLMLGAPRDLTPALRGVLTVVQAAGRDREAGVDAGVRQLMAQGLTLGSIPWYVLLYYGVDSFLKLYPEHAPANAAEQDGTESG